MLGSGLLRFVLLGTVLLAGCGDPPPARRAAPRAGVELLAPDALRERIFAPGDRVRVVNFWATWCGPCEAEMPVLVSFGHAHPEVELLFVDLDLPKLRASKVEPFARSHGLLDFANVQLDEVDAIATLPRLVPDWPDQVPVTLVIAPDGSVRNRYHRALRPGEPALEGGR